MTKWILAHRRILALTLMGTVLGVLGGFWLGHILLLRAADNSLASYARELIANADDLAEQVDSLLTELNASKADFCSDQDLALLKAETFHSGLAKDIGRTRDNKLYCSAFLGRLSHPYIEGQPSLTLDGGLNIYTNVAVLVASSHDGHGTILEAGHTDVVLNSNAFGNWARPRLAYAVFSLNRKSAQRIQLAGSAAGLDVPFSLQPSQVVDGTLLRSICSAKHPVCVVTAERIADVWRYTKSTQIAYSAMGGFAGLSIGLAIFLFHKRATCLSQQILRAVRGNSSSLSVVYQPIIDVHTGECMGVEALLRWNDQNGAPVSPEVFIPLAEEAGFIHELTAFVVRRSTRELVSLLTGSTEFVLSINIAASDLAGEGLFELLDQNVALAGIRPNRIALELTERSTADLSMVSAAIQRLCARGYKVHIDDFGVGFSSLSYIDQLQVDAIKIDRTFTRTIGTEAVMAPILSQMLDMARSLGVEVVVEGVETESQRDYLAESGMDLRAQGWYFSKPLSAETLLSYNAEKRSLQQTATRPESTPTSPEPSTGDLTTPDQPSESLYTQLLKLT